MTTLTKKVEQTGEVLNERLNQAKDAAQDQWVDLTEDQLSELMDKKDELVDSLQSTWQDNRPSKRTSMVVGGSLIVAVLTVLAFILLPSYRRMSQPAS